MKITIPFQQFRMVCIAFALAAVAACPLWAQEAEAEVEVEDEPDVEEVASGTVLGSVVARLGLNASANFHSNPYYRTEGMESDGIVYHIKPHAGLELPLNEFFFIGVEGHLDYAAVDLDDETNDEDRDVLHPYVSGKIRYNLSEYTSFTLSDSFQQANVADTIGGPKYRLNTVKAEGMHELSDRLRGRLWYDNGTLSEDSGSRLFDYMLNGGGAAVEYVITQTDAGRDVTVLLEVTGGQKEFDEEDFWLVSSRTNPKTHTYYSGRCVVNYPVSSALTAMARGGWVQRDYDTVLAGADDSSGHVDAGASLTLRPGGFMSYTLAGSYGVTDTVIFNDEAAFREVFDPVDPLLNNFNINYRELELFRVGLIAEAQLLSRLSAGVACIYERIEGDVTDDLTRVSGQSGMTPRDLSEDRLTFGVRLDYQLMERLRMGINYEHGLAEDNLDDLYEYDTVALTAALDIL